MNITEFAEQIVFGNTLEQKLASPGRLSYDSSASGRLSDRCLLVPGRPVGMQMQPAATIDVAPPRDDQLDNERARGQLLHRLANHELLATELMALVLLKFPDAPIAFRRGVLVTLQEEQEHTRMYLRRMRECGVEFGEHPLSGQFWRVVAPMESPMDFVSRLSLTFEQANLDYSQHFARVFDRIGDHETAAVLQQVYLDEISHVQHGLEWFRQWKDPDQSDWEAYQQSLEFPMSPQRARGPGVAFNREGRQQAGLSDSFIDSVEVFRQSRGRASTVRWFDAGAESELTGQATARERSLLDQLNRDLDFVQVSLAKQDDILLVRELPSRELRKHWIECGIKLPEFRLIEQLDQLSGRRLHDLQPWAWTPNSHRLARPLLQSTRHQPPVWQVSQGDLYRKSWPMAVQDRARDFGGADGEIAGSFVESVAEAQSAIDQIGGRGDYAFALAKRDLGTSGRGQRRISCDGNMTDEDRKWLQTMLGRGGLVIEPLLDRVVDLSFLWRWPVTAQQPKFVGWTRPIVTNGRRYAGTRLGSPFGDCPDDVKRFLLENRCRRLREATSWLEENVVTELQSSGFAGDFGIDAMVYRAKDGALRIRPLVELNPRQTMGHVAQAFKRKPAPGVLAEFRIFTAAEWRALAPAIVERPIEQSRTGQWTSGVVRLSDVQAESKLVPAVLVGPATEL